MKATINREGFLAAFSLAASVCATRTPKPILQDVHFRATEDGSTLMATDLEVGIRARVLGVRVDEPGSVVLPRQHVAQILAASSDEELDLESTDDTLSVRGEHAEFNLQVEDCTLFPEVPDFPGGGFFSVGAGDLRRAINRTLFATDPSSTRYALAGVFFEAMTGGRLSLVATDGRRLARQELDMAAEGEPATPPGQPVVPIKACKLLAKHLDPDDPPVHLALAAEAAIVRTETATLHARLLDGRFPRYADIIPSSHEARIPVDVPAFAGAVRQAMIVTAEESRGVDFAFKTKGLLVLSGKSEGAGKAKVELPVDFSGKAISILFDPRYLLDALGAIDTDADVHLDLVDGKTAAVLRADDGYTYVLMPLTRDQ